MKEIISRLLVALLVVVFEAAYAWQGPAVWWRTCCRGRFEALAEYLYVRPHLCDLDYVIVDARPSEQPSSSTAAGVDLFLPTGVEHGICPRYESAFRVGLGILFTGSCNDFEVAYTRLQTTDSRHAVAPDDGGLWITDGHPRYNNLRLNNPSVVPSTGFETLQPALTALARYRTRFVYNQADGVVGSRCTLWRRGWVRTFIGLRWEQICFRDKAYYQGTITTPAFLPGGPSFRALLNQRSHLRSTSWMWGVGPRIGAELRYPILCGFGIGARGGMALLVGDVGRSRQEFVARTLIAASPEASLTPLQQGLDVNKHSRCHLCADLDARLGANYLYCCPCFSLLVEIGWQFFTCIDALVRETFNDVAGTSEEICQNFTIDGLYASAKIEF
jgi:hypothetical protein